MKQASSIFVALVLLLNVANAIAEGDGPLAGSPHGMFAVWVDENQKLFSRDGSGDFDDKDDPLDRSFFTKNLSGHTILMHSLVGDTGLGGIVERNGWADKFTPATESTTHLLTDDPGFFIEANVFPGVDYLFSVNFHNALRYFAPGATQWSDPLNHEELVIRDINETDGSGQEGSLVVTVTEDTSDLVGTINISETPGGVFGVGSIHGHLAYELSRPDGQRPPDGAYMLELTLSGRDISGADRPPLVDSDPIFVIFNNRLSTDLDDPMDPRSSAFGRAAAAAEALPEPTTGILLVTLGGGWIVFTRRNRQPTILS